jgi:hypothetical protein
MKTFYIFLQFCFLFISRKFTIYSTNGAISKYIVRKHLCGAIIHDDSPIYTVHYVVRASTLLPLPGPLSQRAIAVLVCA